jgi:hypothetical protein
MKHLVLMGILTITPVSVSLAAALTYSDVAPILLGRCVMCHVPNGMMGDPPEGYRLDSYLETVSTVDRARVVPGNALASELFRRIKGHALPRMPFNGPPYLSEEDIERVAQWIDDGARDASGNTAIDISGVRLRLHGKLTQIWELDGLALTVHSGTRIKKSPGIGSYVRVDGRVSADGNTIIADRIKMR